MMFQGDEAGNPSNWWIPNRACIEQMLATAGFAGISTVWEEPREEHWGRLCVHAVPSAGMGHRSPARPQAAPDERQRRQPRRPGGRDRSGDDDR